jgi:hypothetical protein
MTIYRVHVLPHDRVESLSLCHSLAIPMQFCIFWHSDPSTCMAGGADHFLQPLHDGETTDEETGHPLINRVEY